MPGKTNNRKYIFLSAGLLYCFFTVLFFAPCLRDIGSFLIGPAEDNLSHLWDIWWAGRVFSGHPGSLSFSNYIFYPQGSSLVFQALSFYNLFIAVILKPLFNPVLIYNLLILSSFVLSGLGAFMLARYLTGSAYAALIGGFIFAFNPSHFAHSLHHIELASIQFIPFFVLYFIRALRHNSRRDLFLAALFFFLNSISSLYYLVLGIYFIGFSYAYLAYSRKRFFLPDVFRKSAIIILPVVFALAPWLLKMAQLGLRHPEAAGLENPGIFVIDLLALVVPHSYHLLATPGSAIWQINSMFTGNSWEATGYLGVVALVLVILALPGIVKKTLKYFFGALLFLLLSMGTHIHILGWQSPVLLPYALIRHIPLLSVMHTPSRAIVYVYLFLAIIVSFAVKHLYQVYDFKPIRKGMIVSLAALLLFCDYYAVCDEATEISCPSAYKMIKRENGDFGILDLPGSDYTYYARYMMYQTFHEIPIVQGYIARKIGVSLADRLEFRDLKEQKGQLAANKVKYIVLHKYLIPLAFRGRIALYKERYKITHEDDEIIIFQVY
jgi:hypothetical protein